MNSTKLVTIDIRSDRQSGWYQFLAFQFSIHLLHNNTFCIWNLDLVVCGTASRLINNDAIFWNCCTTAISHHRLSRRQDMVSFDGGCSNTKQMFRRLSFWAGVSWWGMHLLSLYTFRIQCKYKRIVSSLMANLYTNISHALAESSLIATCKSLSLLTYGCSARGASFNQQ